MKKYMLIYLAVVFSVTAAAASDLSATIKEVAGKVEYQLPGQGWQKAEPGVVLKIGTVISTGFKSTAVLAVESAVITVKPVTRLTLEELVKSGTTTQTQMFLMTGRVKAEVSPNKGEKADFKIKSPTATASVRGTGFEFDGQNLVVEHGAVAFGSNAGAEYLVGGGEFSMLNDSGAATPAVAAASNSLTAAADNIAQVAADTFLNASDAHAGIQTDGLPLFIHEMIDADTRSLSLGFSGSQPNRPEPAPKPDPAPPPHPPKPEPPKPDTPKPDTNQNIDISVGWED